MPEPSQLTREFLLEEYRRLAEALAKNESVGETRFQYIITLLTAVLAGLIALFTNMMAAHPVFVGVVSAGALLGLLRLGVLTERRLGNRDKTTDRYKIALDRIRALVVAQDSGLREYDPGLPAPDPPLGRRKPGSGGLTETMKHLNLLLKIAVSLVAAALAYQLVFGGLSATERALLSLAITGALIDAWRAKPKQNDESPLAPATTPRGAAPPT